MVAHVGSTQAHPCCLRTQAAIKAASPRIVTVYGGVHPTYHAREILVQHPEVDVIVRGEGEATVVALVEALAGRLSSSAAVGAPEGLAGVAGQIPWVGRGAAGAPGPGERGGAVRPPPPRGPWGG